MTSHFEMAEILSTALNYHVIGGDRNDVLETLLPEENASFTEFIVFRDGERFTVTVEKG